MRISPSGRVLLGVAGVPPSIDNVPILNTCCGYWEWLTPTTAAGQACGGSPERCRMIDEHGVGLEPPGEEKGAHWFRAAQGRWVAVLGGSPARSNFGVSGNNIIPIASDASSGDIAILNDYATGHGVTIYLGNGTTVTLNITVQFADDRTTLRDGLISFVDANAGPRIYDYLNGQEIPFVRLDADWVIGVRTPSGVMLLERTSAGVPRMRLAASSEGVTINEPAYTLDARQIGGNVKIAWGRTQGEEPGTVGWQNVNPADLPHTPGNGTTGPTVAIVRGGVISPAPADLTASVQAALGDEKFSTVLLIAGVMLAVWWVQTHG